MENFIFMKCVLVQYQVITFKILTETILMCKGQKILVQGQKRITLALEAYSNIEDGELYKNGQILKVANCCYKALHVRSLQESWIRLLSLYYECIKSYVNTRWKSKIPVQGSLKNDITTKTPNFRPPPPVSLLVTFFIRPSPPCHQANSDKLL